MHSKNQKLKNSLIELAINDQFIAGICNFCNRWCERCPETHKCLNYAYAQEAKGIDLEFSSVNSDNEIFWNTLTQQNIVQTSELDKNKFPIADLEDFANNYGEEINSWINKNEKLFKEKENQTFNVGEKLEITFSEAQEILSWYSKFIASKINRSKKELNERQNIDTRDKTNPYRDNIGSAKIVIIACRHSKAALSILHHNLPKHENKIKKFITQLALIEDEILQLFPKAMDFKRPGLDE